MHSNKEHLSDLWLQNFNFTRSTKISDLMDIPGFSNISWQPILGIILS